MSAFCLDALTLYSIQMQNFMSNTFYHSQALYLKSACDCFKYILQLRNYKRIYMPFYICAELIHIVTQLNIEYIYYHIDFNLEPLEFPKLERTDAFYYVNYWGLKQQYIEKLALFYKTQLIVDNAQAFFAQPLGVDTFYSARKFYGVNDGAYLYLYPNKHSVQSIQMQQKSLVEFNIQLGSNETSDILSSINYQNTIDKRRENYLRFNKSLQGTNKLQLHLEENATPMIYPYLLQHNSNLLIDRLKRNNIIIEQFWPEVLYLCKSNEIEYLLAANMIPLFIGQTCPSNHIDQVIQIITETI